MAETAPRLTHGRVLKIAVPIVLANVTVPILGAVDTGVVGQMGEAAPIGAVGVGAVVLTAIYWIFGFLRMGTVGLAAQAAGAGDRDEVAALLTRVLLIGAAGGVLLILCQGLLFRGAFAISPASDEVETLAQSYMAIRVWSAPAMIALLGIDGWLIAQERTRALLAIKLSMNLINIVLDLWFVLGLGWGVEGVAVATFIAEWSGLALGLWFCRAAFATPRWRDWPRVFDAARLKRMASLNTDILIRSLLLEGIFVSFVLFGARFGDVTLAANQILLQFLHITAFAMDGFAFAAEALVGQAFGARARFAVRRAAILTSEWGLGVCVVLALAFLMAGGPVIDLMTTSEAVREEARVYLWYMAAAPVIGCAAWMFDGIFIGATRGRDMRNMMIVSVAVYAVAAAILVPPYGNHGLWVAVLICLVARGASLAARYPALEAAAEEAR